MLLLSGSWSFELDDGPSNRMMVLRAGPWSFVPNDGSSSRSTAAKRGNTAKALHVGGTRMLLVSLAAVRVSAICAADLARACTLLLLLQGGVFSDDAGGGGKVAGEVSSGPVFIKEPPNRVDFSNTTGAVVECLARGNPQPEIIWVLANGNLVFTPFRAEDYRQEVHAQVYACLAKNTEGSITSRDVNVRAVVNQYYEAQVYDVFVIKGNTAVFKCQIPSFVSDHVEIVAWQDTDNNKYLPPGRADDYDSKYLVLPSGELHIKDVGPEDGYKSYQCRTKHRLTGETRLSATKGRLVITGE
ncbi:unnamed protein product [Callosobruchus maculatus]|uniref:Ig-like domain-containing protein n=1 Tax=Callosobruchus maculatus TaxID=64391 RepID=A0A653C9H8_CALMS|nr:unnamed protein product [Callosobruchus maculatus]